MYPFTYKMCLVFYNEPSEVYAVRNFAFGIFICLTWMLFFYLSSGKFSGNARSRITSKIQHHYVSNAWVNIELFHSSQYILHMVLPGMLGIGFQTSALCEMNIFLLTPLISISKILFFIPERMQSSDLWFSAILVYSGIFQSNNWSRVLRELYFLLG